MHIQATNHEHGATAKVYTYEGDYDVGPDAISWTAAISQGGSEALAFQGTIAMTSPAVASLAEMAVRDAIVQRIDAFDDRYGESLDRLSTSRPSAR